MGGLPIGDVLGDIAETYRTRAVDLLALSALKAVLGLALTFILLWALFGPLALDLLGSGAAGPFGGLGPGGAGPADDPAPFPVPPDLPVGLMESTLILSAVAGLVAVILVPLDGAMVARAHGGRDIGPDLGDAFRRGLSRFRALAGAMLMVQVLILLLFALPMAVMVSGIAADAPVRMLAGLIGAVVGGVIALILYVGLFLFIPAAVVEDEGAMDALRRSWALTRGHRLKVFLLIIVVALIAGVVGLALMAPFLFAATAGGSTLLIQGPALVAATLVGPLFPLLAQAVHARLVAEPARGQVPPEGGEAEYVPLDG